MALRLAPVTQEDVPRLVDILWAAMSASAFFRATGDMPNPENKDDTVDASVRREMQIRRYIDNWGQDPTMRLFKVVDSETGEMIAFSRWHLFLSQDDLARWRATRKAGAVMEIPAGANGPAYRYTWEKMYTKAREVFGDDGRPHYHLMLLATDPMHHRRGAGSLLLKWGCQLADEQGVECYLEASKLGYPLYLREGFRDALGEDKSMLAFDVGQFTGRGGADGDWVRLTVMVRPPQTP